ncbi:Protein FATTY ACID EXPORT 1- chloroplastic [Striga hermonthica]|uniref:Protein FATTY ACID EXPORT 1- chloroplastic n=1 Tax=Striga hermonthica TaxID=68872 RepID=A0A9N7RMU8_STRHE|nr:Protein FATTY ACID EXPORT 1- chloroplastic [Striga hermonthica]
MPSAIAQMSCFSSTISSRRLPHKSRSYSFPAGYRSVKVLNVISSDGHSSNLSNLENGELKSHNGTSIESEPLTEGSVIGASNGHTPEVLISQPKRAAKIHDFCFGIPFGGLVLSGGLVGFIFTRNPVSLRTDVLYGGALLALSTISLKVWRHGKSSLPFILGQAVLSIALLRKNFQAYALTKKLFPTGFSIVISAAMLTFYSYVVLSGGNPPPKKLKSSESVESS